MSDNREKEFLKRLLATFTQESAEHIRAISSGLIKLEKTVDQAKKQEILERMFREAHSLKGAARAVNIKNIETICQLLESVFAANKSGKLIISSSHFDTLHRAVDLLGRIQQSPDSVINDHVIDAMAALNEVLESRDTVKISSKAKQLPHTDSEKVEAVEEVFHSTAIPDVDNVEESLDSSESKEGGIRVVDDTVAATAASATATTGAETMRVATSKMDGLLGQSEELLSIKLMTQQRASDFRAIHSEINRWKKQWLKALPDIKQNLRLIKDLSLKAEAGPGVSSQLNRLYEVLESNDEKLNNTISAINGTVRDIESDQRYFSQVIDQIQDDLKQIVLMPFSSLLEIFPKMVRDQLRDQGKSADLEIFGDEIEVDRRILEEMRDPLIHLVRNCIDHGIESPSVRKKNNKPEKGTISISIQSLEGGKFEIQISDDGAGIQSEKVKTAALKKGIIDKVKAKSLNDTELNKLIFQSGISTSDIITDISGRGLGLAIVQEKVEKLNGEIHLDVNKDQDTTFRFVLPVTLSKFRGVLITVNDEQFILPSRQLIKVLRLRKEDINSVKKRAVIQYDGETLPLVDMARILEMGGRNSNGKNSDGSVIAVVMGQGDLKMAFAVDDVISDQEVMVKSLGNQLRRIRNVAAATLLASGHVVLILNVSDLFKSALILDSEKKVFVDKTEDETKPQLSILVAEDSITSRMLLKNILESAGYSVKTAIDGAEAFANLKMDSFDLLVSDVDMPRMNGFELTAKVRSDSQLSDLPIVLVTSLESREDREKGVDAGANAYIVKRSFDQVNLLEVVARLVG